MGRFLFFAVVAFGVLVFALAGWTATALRVTPRASRSRSAPAW